MGRTEADGEHMTVDTNAPTFKDQNRALQELVRDYMLLLAHNLQSKEGDDLQTLLLFSEGAVVIVEHFGQLDDQSALSSGCASPSRRRDRTAHPKAAATSMMRDDTTSFARTGHR